MIQACIISVGNELLNGHTADTNACWLSGKLFETGIATGGIWCVPDEVNRIVNALKDAAEIGQLLLVTGGLGPTEDDLTREAMAGYLGVELEFHQHLLDSIDLFFKKRGKTMASTNRRQAYIPTGAEILDNPMGTAAGFSCSKGPVQIAVMPGVPSEMKQMFESHIMPQIGPLAKEQIVVSGKLRCYGVGESTIAEKLGDLMKRGRNPQINSTCGSGDIILHVVAKADSPEAARDMLEKDKALIRQALGTWIYGQDDQSLPAVVAELLKTSHKTIALAESCTGGLLSKMITDLPGASDYFLGSWITYSNASKIIHLGIPEKLLLEHGAVSEPVARAMARNISERFRSDIGVGITGVAGPDGGTEEKPVGLVYIGVQMDDKCHVQECRFGLMERRWIRQRSALTALNLIRLRLKV